MTQTAQKGTFLQLPSVFIETCDLPETAQIMYIRMLHTFGYKGIYTGSLRKLAHVVRMSKSTVDRMLDVLSHSHLISRGNTEASETAQSILQVSLDPEYLWNANIEYCSTHTVPNWDSMQEGEVSQDRTSCPNLGRAVPVTGQAVPTRTLKRAPNITKTIKTIKEDSLVVSADAEDDGGALFLSQLSSFEETLEEVQQEENGKTPPSLSASTKEEGRPEEPPRVDTLPECDTNEPTRKSTEPLPTQVALLPAVLLSSEGEKNTPSLDKTVRSGKNKKVEDVPLCSSRVIREGIDAIRGYALDQEGPMKHERVVLKAWCKTHTLEDYKLVIAHCTTGQCANKKHQFWREGTNFASFFNADKLAELTPAVLACTGHIPKPAMPGEVGKLPEPGKPTMVMDPYTAKILELAAETRARYTPQAQGVAL